MKIGLVLTNDWELFGDGSGDYFELQQKPLENFHSIQKDYNAKITIMAEVMQQITMKKHNYGNNITNSWDEILKTTIKNGNDVQLHIHPQWLDAKIEQNSIELSENWSIGKLDYSTKKKLISDGKSYLESLLKGVNPDYECAAFRAGAYYIEPSKEIINILEELGFWCDTSVTKGLVSEEYDYTDAHSNFMPWKIKESVIRSNSEGKVIEMPIYSTKLMNSNALKKLSKNAFYKFKYGLNLPQDEIEWENERDKIKEKRYPKSQRLYRKKINKNLNWYLSQFYSNSYQQLDYDYLPATVFTKILNEFYHKNKNSKFEVIPLIASGHFKDTHNLDNIKKIFELIDNNLGDNLVYLTLTEAVNVLLNNKNFFEK